LAVLTTAKLLHSKLWGKDINSVLEQVLDCSESYLSQTNIINLGLSDLGYTKEALLIQEEYMTAITMLEGPFQGYEGVIITSQPGIGMLFTIVQVLLPSLSENN